MLRSFRLTNHRSFAAEQELSLLPVYDRDQAALPVAAIYGANASGKSNLLDGLAFMQAAVLRSFQSWDAEGGVPRHPFRLDPALRAQPSGYVVEIVIGEVRYTYGFTVSDDRVLEEWLYSYPEKKRRVLFERLDGRIRFGSTVGSERAKLDLLYELTRPNALFVSVASQSESELVLPIHRWFRTALTFPEPWSRSTAHAVAKRVQDYLGAKLERKRILIDLLASADVGITDFDITSDEGNASAEQMQHFKMIVRALLIRDSHAGETADEVRAADIVRRTLFPFSLRLRHGSVGELFDFAEESAGTRSWLSLLPDALDALDTGGAMFIDEIDASLHPLLTARLIGLFREAETNPHGAQLIFTTHDASLIGTALGEEVLERDQIWFVEKDRGGASRLYPLSDFKPREGENRERRYLGGSYGAVPVVSATGFAEAVRGG
ncbi:MAG TPA: ATP-binding protein [Pseudonocardiaceae bacterium]|nr:ATP-binding protein [Pseudonocardiaceae bacterium]